MGDCGDDPVALRALTGREVRAPFRGNLFHVRASFVGSDQAGGGGNRAPVISASRFAFSCLFSYPDRTDNERAAAV